VKVIPHPYAKPEFGTGLVMMCSYGDYGDIRLLRELNIEPTYAINQKGEMNEKAQMYNGLKVEEARAKIIQDLKNLNLLAKKERILHREPICERSKDPIEFIPMKEIYLKQVESKNEMLKITNDTNFFAPESRQILINWINFISIDWVLSRRRYYGTEIPIWYCRKCGEASIPTPGKYYKPWKEKCPISKCPKCGDDEFIGETRIFDTWFDSSTTELYILGYLWDKDFFRKNFPSTMRPQGKEIVRNWLYFTILKSLHLFKTKPFANVWVHMHVVDEKGEKMSKSQGNIINPQDVINKFGCEAFRIWTCLEGDITRGDIKCSFDRIQGHSKFLTKLWNISKFISSFPIVSAEPTNTDKWILGYLSNLIQLVKKKYDVYAFHDVATLIRDFTWDVLASNCIEMIKARAYGKGFSEEEQKSAWFTLHECLKNILLLLSPIIPIITDHLWKTIYGPTNISAESFPELSYKTNLISLTDDLIKTNLMSLTDDLISFNSKVWNIKKERGLSLKEPLQIQIPEELKIFYKDLKAMHNIID
jgi:valyl-tRNA synthetase